MEMYVMHNETVICSSPNMTVIPRIGEKLSVNGNAFRVKDVVWRIKEGANALVIILV